MGEDEDLYFQKTKSELKENIQTDQTSGSQSDQRVDEIDTDDEINEILDTPEQISKQQDSEKISGDEVDRIIRNNPILDLKTNKLSQKGLIEFSYTKDENYCLSDYSDENEKSKLYLFAPYIFYVAEDIDDSVSTIILKNGGCIDDAIDHTTTHVI